MGHVRLGDLPQTRKWKQVVALLKSGAGTGQVAAATLDASQRGLDQAARDPALVHSFWLLTQIPLCAKGEQYQQGLRRVGLSIDGAPGILDLVGAFADSIDAHVRRSGGRTDLGEMAQMGAAETLTSTLRRQTPALFGTSP